MIQGAMKGMIGGKKKKKKGLSGHMSVVRLPEKETEISQKRGRKFRKR